MNHGIRRLRWGYLLVAAMVCATLWLTGAMGRPAAAADFQPGPQLMPPHPNLLADLQAQGYDSVTVVNLHHLAQLRAQKGIDQPEVVSAPVLGNRPALVLLVEFSDLSHNAASPASLYQNLLFSAGSYPAPGSMRDFYQQASYGAFDINPGTVDSAWRRAAQAHNYYANGDGIPGSADDYGFGSYPTNAQGLVVNAVNLANPYLDFSTFAVSGQVQLFVVHAGRGAETDSSRYDWIWSHKWTLPYDMIVDGVVVNNYTMEPEYTWNPGDSTIGIFAHEYGHFLGLPDLYDTDYTSEGLGSWSLMAGGSWNGNNGSSPAFPDAWCRIELGWVTPTVVSSNLLGAGIPAAESNATVYKLTNSYLSSAEYYLVENRQRTGFDAYLPAAGLCIYHIDDNQSGNDNEWYPGYTSSGHYLVALEQADGLWELEKALDSGDSGDPWPGSTVKRAFNNTSTPNSKNYAGQTTYIGVEAISDSAATMTANLLVQIGPPAAPTGLTATVPFANEIDLAWTDNASNETGYRIERKAGAGGSWLEIATTPANAVSYQDMGLSFSTTYYYRVRAYNSGGNSDYSNEASAATYALPGPSSLTATAPFTNQINLSWRDNSSDETGFRIDRKTAPPDPWREIATVAANATSCQDTGLTPGTTYYYIVLAYNGTGVSPYSNQASATTPVINPPSGLTATTLASNQLRINWADNSGDETGFKIERKTGATGTWAQITTVAVNVTSYTNTGLAANTAYYYRVRSYNAGGNSPYSNEANATTFVVNPPSTLTATTYNANQINLAWRDNSTNETGFKIERKTGAGGAWAQIATVGANVVSYQSKGLTPSTSYYFRVRSYYGTGNSPYSNEANATTRAAPNIPSGLSATPVSASRIDLAWSDNSSDETGFAIDRKTGVGGTWAQVATVAANVVSYANSGLQAATAYYYRVRAYNANGSSLPSAEANATTLPLPAPDNLTATTATASQINLAWRDNSTNETGFKIERKTGAGGSWAQIATTAANVVAYNNTGLTPVTTYYYRVRAYNSVSNSDYSGEANATTNARPGAPTGLTATAASASQINLVWTDNATDETGYKIERKTGATGAWAQITTVGASVTSYNNTGLAAYTAYYYRVRSYNTNGDSAYSNEANATTIALPAPDNLTATAVTASQINLAWRDNSANETGFKIERKTGAAGTWAQIATTAANVVTYSNTGLSQTTEYYYRVRAYNSTHNSTYSNEANATTFALPATPTGLTATAASASQINLAWADNAADETGYKIERKTGATGTWAQIATAGANATSYNNTGLAALTAYYYRVRAYNANGNSGYSNEANATTLNLTAPGGLTATAVSASQINLGWTDTASNETGFKIERKTGATGAWAQIATVVANIVSYSNTGLSPSTTYYYRVRSYTSITNSPYSNEANATTRALPIAPSGLTATSASASQINLAWTDNSADEQGFKIERKTGSAGAWGQIATVGANVTTYNNPGLSAYTTYFFRVRSYNTNGNSAYSNEASATPALPTPTNLAATPVSSTQINLTWQDRTSNETGFKIERKTGASGAWTQIAAVAANIVSYSNTGLTANTRYYYRVRAYNASGNSAYSNEANASTLP